MNEENIFIISYGDKVYRFDVKKGFHYKVFNLRDEKKIELNL